MVSGLASTIRSTQESTTFDLSGHDVTSIQSLITDAFATDFFVPSNNNDVSMMIRLTFLVGAGKQSRSRYDPQAARAVTSTLKNKCGYEEDHGASCILECGGSFKLQHDTAKNLKTVVVFPRPVDSANHGGKNGNNGTATGSSNNNNGEGDEPLIPHNSPGYKIAISSLTTFQSLLSTYCPTYLQKMNCKQTIESLLQVEKSIEQKMMKGHVLDGGESSFYEDATELQEKMSFCQKEMGKHIEDGRLTVDEKKLLLKMNEKRILSLQKEMKDASSPSLKSSVKEWLEKAQSRKEQLQSLTDDVLNLNPTYPPPLRYESQLNTLRKKLLPLRKLEEASKGRLLNINETKAMTEKEELEEEVERLEEASAGWFEEDDAFRERVRRSRERFDAKYNTSGRKQSRSAGGKMMGARGAGGGRVSNNNTVNKWILPGEKPKNAWSGAGTGKKKLKGRGGAVFSAMMMDSSSDEEEDDDDEEEEEEIDHDEENSSDDEEEEEHFVVVSAKKQSAKKPNSSAIISTGNKNNHKTKPQAHPNPGIGTEDVAQSMPTMKKSKKNNKKKNKSKQRGTIVSDDEDDWEAMKEAQAENSVPSLLESNDNNINDDGNTDNNEKTAKTESSTVSNSFIDFLKSFLFPIIMAILDILTSFLVGLVGSGGKNKSGKSQKRNGTTTTTSATVVATTGSKKGKKKKN